MLIFLADGILEPSRAFHCSVSEAMRSPVTSCRGCVRICPKLSRTSSRQCRIKVLRMFFLANQMLPKGEVRIGPDLVTNPALHVTREMEDIFFVDIAESCHHSIRNEDHITWAEGSKMRRHIKEFSNEAIYCRGFLCTSWAAQRRSTTSTCWAISGVVPHGLLEKLFYCKAVAWCAAAS